MFNIKNESLNVRTHNTVECTILELSIENETINFNNPTFQWTLG